MGHSSSPETKTPSGVEMFYIPLVIITMSGAEHDLPSFYYLGNQDNSSTWNFKQKRRSAEATNHIFPYMT